MTTASPAAAGLKTFRPTPPKGILTTTMARAAAMGRKPVRGKRGHHGPHETAGDGGGAVENRRPPAHEQTAKEFAQHRRRDPGQDQKNRAEAVTDKGENAEGDQCDEDIQSQSGRTLGLPQMRRAGHFKRHRHHPIPGKMVPWVPAASCTRTATSVRTDRRKNRPRSRRILPGEGRRARS